MIGDSPDKKRVFHVYCGGGGRFITCGGCRNTLHIPIHQITNKPNQKNSDERIFYIIHIIDIYTTYLFYYIRLCSCVNSY